MRFRIPKAFSLISRTHHRRTWTQLGVCSWCLQKVSNFIEPHVHHCLGYCFHREAFEFFACMYPLTEKLHRFCFCIHWSLQLASMLELMIVSHSLGLTALLHPRLWFHCSSSQSQCWVFQLPEPTLWFYFRHLHPSSWKRLSIPKAFFLISRTHHRRTWTQLGVCSWCLQKVSNFIEPHVHHCLGYCFHREAFEFFACMYPLTEKLHRFCFCIHWSLQLASMLELMIVSHSLGLTALLHPRLWFHCSSSQSQCWVSQLPESALWFYFRHLHPSSWKRLSILGVFS